MGIIEYKLSLMRKEPELDFFLKEIAQYDPVIYGGFVRDLLSGKEPSDLDIVLLKSPDTISFISPPAFNKFGGIRFNIAGVDIDLWRIQDTKWIKEFDLEPNLWNLFKHTNLDCNKIVYFINSGLIVRDTDLQWM